ncbi:type IV secretory system conjugative DNA transfer family protein [Nitratireductor sp. XY-223]|uniref:type IV secretory system conjugative DNA transfer family protein n=1 Tax=Nitratireductor sp. XY-223 TaxID=2561926 RepID=UPI0010AA6E42|nr:type IV secretory system conjugative DNA transfer family protein [Nitratireductor sp. XY-223]
MNRCSALLICSVPLFLALSGCQTTSESELEEPAPIAIGGPDRYKSKSTPASFSEFKSKTRRGDFDAEMDQERYGLLREAAVSYAAQAGYQRRVWQIMRELERDSAKLSQSFDFNRVAYRAPRETGYLLPPVVSHATAAINVAETGRSAVATDEYYRIEIPGRLVSVVPTWRDYLIIPLEEATEPGDDFLPQNREERRVFDQFAAKGWQAGVDQANEALELNLARLKRDYLGMVEYRKMVQAGLVEEMVVRSSEQRSAGEGDELFIGERRVKIVSAARLVRNPNHWKPLERRYSVAK